MTQHDHSTDSSLTRGDFLDSTDPIELFRAWLSDAADSEPNDPNAVALATVDGDGAPDVRIVLLKGVDERGFSFFTNLESAKGQQLSANPVAALAFFWKTLGRQVRVRGPVERLPDREADAYFATRPRLSQIGAWASRQSRPLETRTDLDEEVARIEAEYTDRPVPRPPHWSGFRLLPLQIEFWHNRPFRLHDRLIFRRNGLAAPFTRLRLYP